MTEILYRKIYDISIACPDCTNKAKYCTPVATTREEVIVPWGARRDFPGHHHAHRCCCNHCDSKLDISVVESMVAIEVDLTNFTSGINNLIRNALGNTSKRSTGPFGTATVRKRSVVPEDAVEKDIVVNTHTINREEVT